MLTGCRDNSRPASRASFKGQGELGESVPPATAERQLMELQLRIRRRYATVTQIVNIGSSHVPFTRIADPDDMAAHMDVAGPAGAESPRWQPYWAANWDAVWGVARVLEERPLAGRAVLDLGCGLGLSGMVAGAGGAHVTMVDAAQPALLFARLNTWPWRAQVRVRRVDWRRDRLNAAFDLIVGSDIIYDSEDWPYLARFWQQHLAPGGQLLLGESGRRTGAEFPGWLAARGWQVELSQLAVPECPRPLRIVEARRV